MSSCHTHTQVTAHIGMRHGASLEYKGMAYRRMWSNLASTVGWLRLGGSFKLEVSFAKEPYKRDHILKKRPLISRSLLIVATPRVPWHTKRHGALWRHGTQEHSRIYCVPWRFAGMLLCAMTQTKHHNTFLRRSTMTHSYDEAP